MIQTQAKTAVLGLAIAATVAQVGCGSSVAATSATSPTAVAESSRAARPTPPGAVHSTGRYEMWSEPDLNLHLFLYQWARSLTEEGRRLSVPERDELDSLPEADRQAWAAAVERYRELFGKRDLVFSRELNELRDALVGTIPEVKSLTAVEATEVLTSVREVYRRHWWPAHDRVNRAWIAEVAPVVESLQEPVIARLESIYGVSWEPKALRLDVTSYAGDYGAYTTQLGGEIEGGPRPPHLTIASADSGNELPQGAEIVFHESLHSDRMEGAMRVALEAAFGEQRQPRRFWHRLLFYNAGEAVREAFAAAGEPDYQTYSERYGLWSRGPAAARAHELLKAHWQEYLEGRVSRAEALRRIVVALAAD